MGSRVVGLRVGGVVFGLIAVAQVLRLLIRPEVLVNGHLLPLWPSVLAAVILGGLCVWLLGLSGGSARATSLHE